MRLQSNIWKYFFFTLTTRRNYYSLLSIYFLTLPNSTANMIGLYMAAGSIAAFFFEIPSGYLSDIVGHKKVMVLSKVFMILSTSCYLFIQNFWGFVAGAVLVSLAFSARSGASSAFMHDTLKELKRDDEYSKIMGRLHGNAALVSMVLIILLPFLVPISIILPFVITLVLDIFGLGVTLSLKNPTQRTKAKTQSVWKVVKSLPLPFYPFSIFLGTLGGFLVAESAFRYPYLDSLGFPVVLVGVVMGLSRLIWFISGRYAYLIEKHLSMSQHLLAELVLYLGYFIVAALYPNPIVLAIIFILGVGYAWGRGQVLEHYVLKYFVADPKYKATVLSIYSQTPLIATLVISSIIGYVMQTSYQLGYGVMGAVLAVVLVGSLVVLQKWKPQVLDHTA